MYPTPTETGKAGANEVSIPSGRRSGRGRTRAGVLLFLLFWVASTTFAGGLRHLNRMERRKLDSLAELLLLQEHVRGDRLVQLQSWIEGQEPLVPLLVKGSAAIVRLVSQLGGFVGSSHGRIYTAYLPVRSLPELAASPEVEFVEVGKGLEPELDTSVPEIGASFVHRIPLNGVRGSGVVVGVTDSGIDFRHPDFGGADGRTRILFLWDQLAASGEPPHGFSYGREWTRAEIEQGLPESLDRDGHGTRVAGIAAGAGRAEPYTGVAPGAWLVVVRRSGGMFGNIVGEQLNTAGLLDAYAYIRARAKSLGMPWVINTSLGTTIGPHDGSTLLCQAVNEEVRNGSVIVVSAGNYANKGWHAEVIVPPLDSLDIPIEVRGDEKSIYVDVWYEGQDSFALRVGCPSGEFVGAVSGDTAVSYRLQDGRIWVVAKSRVPLNGDSEFFLQLADPLEGGYIRKGRWTLRLVALNELPAGGEVDAWMIRDVEARFIDYVDVDETIGALACCDSVIAVASYNNKSSPRGQISSFSSRGPRRDGLLKPDLAAPGGGVVAPRSLASEDQPYGDHHLYAYGSGTSFSAPHVAGAVALLLQLDPTLRAGEVRRRLAESARSDRFTGSTPNPVWGAGKLDVIALLRPYLRPAQVSVVVHDVDGRPVDAQVRVAPVGVDYPELAASAWFASEEGSVPLELLPGVYDCKIFPSPPYAVTTDSLAIPVDAESVQVTFKVKIADAVLVDDEPEDCERFFTEVLDSLRLRYAMATSDTDDVPPLGNAARLMEKPVVIWFTGRERENALTAEERDSLAGFLEKGGRLLLSGQNILEAIDGTDLALDYLRCVYAGNTRDRLLVVSPADPLAFGKRFLLIGGTGGADNQVSPDVLSPLNGAEPFAFYDDSLTQAAGVLVADPSRGWRVVFLGFGLEAVARPPGREDFVDRTLFLRRAIEWLRGEVPGGVSAQSNSNVLLPRRSLLVCPNPAWNGAKLRIRLPQTAAAERQQNVRIQLYNVLGRKVAEAQLLPDENGELLWTVQRSGGRALASGLYLLVVRAGWQRFTSKVVVLR